jgi:hypothetical protein
MGLFDEKTRGRKSRDTVPLRLRLQRRLQEENNAETTALILILWLILCNIKKLIEF